MSADPQTTTPAAAAGSERFVKIPHALPGQEYKAPKNFPSPFINGVYRIAAILLSVSLPLAPGVIFFMILAYSKAIEMGFLWIWIPMIVFIEVIAVFVAWGIAREALGYPGVMYSPTRR